MPKRSFCSLTLRLAGAVALALLALPSVRALAQAENAAPAGQVATAVVVRAVAQDAKVIGDHVGGARITIRDLATGRLLARGLQTGATGDTRKIMIDARARAQVLYDTPGTAAFTATLMLEQPTEVEIVAEGPLGNPQATQRAATTMLLIPGEDVVGDGVVLTIHGFIVTLLAPEDAAVSGETIPVRATVTLACGCPTEPGGLWNADDITVVAQLVRDGEVVGEASLRYAGEQSTYAGTLPAAETGTLQLRVLAMDAGKANFGRAWKQVQITR